MTESEIEILPEVPEDEVLDLGSNLDDSESIVDEDEYPEGDVRVIADALVTNDGEAIADVMVGIRDALETISKVMYKYLKNSAAAQGK